MEFISPNIGIYYQVENDCQKLVARYVDRCHNNLGRMIEMIEVFLGMIRNNSLKSQPSIRRSLKFALNAMKG